MRSNQPAAELRRTFALVTAAVLLPTLVPTHSPSEQIPSCACCAVPRAPPTLYSSFFSFFV